MRFETFSEAQLTALTWWSDDSPHYDCDAIICDGAVRSGKTLCMGISFVCWAMRRFDGMQFGVCGKTILSLRRNVISVLLPVMRDIGFVCEEKKTENRIEISFGGRRNTFYLFGGGDESSAAHIQGITFAGVLLDEAALMPRSFVEQACARCSVEGSRFWFNCNPEGPYHWFYTEWIQKAEEKNALYVRFRMEDNPALSRRMIARYRRLYSGIFYRRFILGEWVAAEGLVYDFFDESYAGQPPRGELEGWAVSCDYGTANPASFGLWGLREGVWYRLREYYYDSRKAGRQKTDAEYVADLLGLLEGKRPRFVVVDPSAASFIEALRREGLPVIKADNDVLTGIRVTADMLRTGRLVICKDCGDAIREFSLYQWAGKAPGRDVPVKRDDHAMDDIRYFAMAVSRPEPAFAATYVERRGS
ncbi:MAG TPA: PBSX family phage terminase large subunit [Clostridiales bacterium]|nr:PBSX family phage terminase large subunit [Clostridiales bacterium]HBR09235.1 PBSX family phage terminase large subunit [Clostridiales bacterium]